MKDPENEHELTGQVLGLLKQFKFQYFKHWGGPLSIKGIPDVYVTLPGGRACWIELKGPSGKPTDEQMDFIQRHSAAGALAFFAYSIEAVITNLADAGVECMIQVRKQFKGGLRP